MSKFDIAVQFLVDKTDGFDAEGGYSNNPDDPGGETKYGISKRAHPELDIKNLTLEEAIDIYRSDYWDFYNLDAYPSPLCICLLDAYVQHRPSVVKPMISQCNGDWRVFVILRRAFYDRLIQKNPSLAWARKGWKNRMDLLVKYCQMQES